MSAARRLVRAWELIREAGVELFQPGASVAVARVPGWSALGLSSDAATPAVSVTEVLRALDLLNGRIREGAHSVAVVATMPRGVTREIATTRDAVIALVQSSTSEVLVLGFALTDRALREAMIVAGKRGVQFTIVGERSRDDLLEFARAWPAILKPAAFLQLVEPQAGVSALMHAKVVVADRRRMLVGSANFTSGGLNSNLELGVLIEGPAAESVCRLVALLTERHWFEPLTL